jgi:hypothetical protein
MLPPQENFSGGGRSMLRLPATGKLCRQKQFGENRGGC